MAKSGFIKSYEPNKLIFEEGIPTEHLFLIESGLVSLQVAIEKSKINSQDIEKPLLPFLKKLPEKLTLQVYEKGCFIRNRRCF